MYKSWAKSFYPDDLPTRRQLEFYSSKFPTVEINATFYRLQQEKTFESWQEQSCQGFLYAVKGSQTVTHFKRLRPGAKSFSLLLKRAGLLRSGLGPFLWQLPPNFTKNADRFC